VICAIERAPQRRRNTEDRKNAIRDVQSRHLFRIPLPGYTDRISLVNPDVLKDAVLLAIDEVVGRRHIYLIDVQSRRRVPDSHQRLRVRIRQRLKQDAFDNAEDRDIRTDTGGKGNHRDGGENGRTPKPPYNLPDLAE